MTHHSVLLLTLASILAAGCSVRGEEVGSAPFGGPTVHNPYRLDASSDASATDEASDTGFFVQTAATQGSPLCNASALTACVPDMPTTAKDCHKAPDGGAFDPEAGYGEASLGCHVVRRDGGDEVTPACLPVGPGLDGSSCRQSTDCAPGNECVGTGVCRHYCCSGNRACGADLPDGEAGAWQGQFCDIRPTLESQLPVPVCVPLKPCRLLNDVGDPSVDACAPLETCAVVWAENGATSCVPVGEAHAGESCEMRHCAAGLMCLGGQCLTLCHTANPVQCARGQTCTGGLPVFPDPLVGLCDRAADAN
jgi:hypothetical protein